MKKTSLFLYGNSRTDKSGRRREESGRKSREGTGTTDVGETFCGVSLMFYLTLISTGIVCVFCYKELRSRKNETK
jgi:hypothetical protein